MSSSFKIDLQGRKYGEWTVISFVSTKSRNVIWSCRCSCGVVRDVSLRNLRSGASRSCGHVFYSTIAELFPERSKMRIRGRKRTAKLDVLYDYFNGARQRSLLWALNEAEFDNLTSSDCHYCGAEPNNERVSKRGDSFIYNGIDRLNNTLGYTLENSVPCCRWCNRAKNISSVDEFVAHCAKVALHRDVVEEKADGRD